MPQLVKGGKHTFGWSRVGDTGRIVIPPEALKQYGLEEAEELFLVPGSRTSGGFGLGCRARVRRIPWAVQADFHSGPGEGRVPEGQAVLRNGKPYCWVTLHEGGVVVPPETLGKYGVATGDKLLVIRGSGLAIGFAVRGPIVELAERHPELEVWE
jgi:bifunctional DNA-binding transcriptional regulator/antitoxin component of YhaV-PrlF toxin-antitoxin module